jgi:hypothetical protein
MPTTLRKVTLTGQDRRYLIGGSDARIIMGADEDTNDHVACRGAQHEKGRKAERPDPHNQLQNLNQHWCGAITGRMPRRWYIVAVCYWTIVILLGTYPSNILLMLLALAAMDFLRRDQTARRWCPVDTGHDHER